MVLQESFQFNGVKGGIAWKEKIGRYMISRAPVLKEILEWAESTELETITPELFRQAVGTALTHEQILNTNAAMWGLLSGAVSGSAETMFNRADVLNGLDAWRRLSRYVDHGRAIRLETLRREVKMLHMRPIKSIEMVEQGIAEFENTMAEYFQVGGTRPKDPEMKADLLAILPAELRETLLWRATDDGPFVAFRDMVVSQAGKILMNRQKLPVHAVG